jgi:hypothetical protein
MIEEKICIWYEQYLEQKAHENHRYGDAIGITGFNNHGCHECKGKNTERKCYVPANIKGNEQKGR